MQQIQFKNNCGCIVDEDLLSRAIHSAFPNFRKRKTQKRSIYLAVLKRGKYPVVSVTQGGIERQCYVSRLIAQQVWPDKMTKRVVVHHKNQNSLDNTVENLGIMTLGEHSFLHNINKHKCPPYEQDKNDVIQLYQDGFTLRQIGEKYHCHRKTISRRFKQWNIPRRPQGTRGVK